MVRFRIMLLKNATLALFAAFAIQSVVAEETPAPIAEGPSSGRLLIAPCSTSLPLGKASLRIGTLSREAGAYVGDYQIQVTPVFIASEKGRLTVAVPDASLRKLTSGNPIEFTGRAITSGSGKTRPVDGTAIPSGNDRGTVKVWFTADKRKVVFTSTYRFAGK